MVPGAKPPPPAPAAAAATGPSTPPPTVDRGCPGRRALRSSDLCAQWTAADAARDAATWARLSFWGGLFSLVILVVTLWQTRAAVAETRRIGQEQTRAYLEVSDARSELRVHERFELQSPRLNAG